jgi:hypothetical protein
MRQSAISGLLFSLALAFGLLSVLTIKTVYLSVNEMNAIAASVDPVELPKSETEWREDMFINQSWPFLIKLDGSTELSKKRKIVLVVTNVSSETVYLNLSDRSGKLPVFVANAFPWSENVLADVDTRVLASNDSTKMSFALPNDIPCFDLSFTYSPTKPGLNRSSGWGDICL